MIPKKMTVKDKLTFDGFRGKSRQNKKNNYCQNQTEVVDFSKPSYSNKTSETKRTKFNFTLVVHNQNCPKHIPHPNIIH